ncbi:MAG: hypothetical protein VCA55_00265, partial [Verrucomicrobiales bacterium]
QGHVAFGGAIQLLSFKGNAGFMADLSAGCPYMEPFNHSISGFLRPELLMGEALRLFALSRRQNV